MATPLEQVHPAEPPSSAAASARRPVRRRAVVGPPQSAEAALVARAAELLHARAGRVPARWLLPGFARDVDLVRRHLGPLHDRRMLVASYERESARIAAHPQVRVRPVLPAAAPRSPGGGLRRPLAGAGRRRRRPAVLVVPHDRPGGAAGLTFAARVDPGADRLGAELTLPRPAVGRLRFLRGAHRNALVRSSLAGCATSAPRSAVSAAVAARRSRRMARSLRPMRRLGRPAVLGDRRCSPSPALLPRRSDTSAYFSDAATFVIRFIVAPPSPTPTPQGVRRRPPGAAA